MVFERLFPPLLRNSGEIFIGTSKGLVSYQSNATEAAKSFKKEEVYAYPNPVRPDYTGVITITGLMYESNGLFFSVKW